MAALASIPLPATQDGAMLQISGNAIAAALYRTRAQGIAKTFAPISLVSTSPFWLVANPAAIEASTMAGLLTQLRAHPGQYRLAFGAAGWIAHLTGENMKQRAALDVESVEYGGATNALLAVLSGESHMMFSLPVDAEPHVAAGRLRVLATTAGYRTTAHPEIPTMMEQGFADFRARSWVGFALPAGASRDQVAVLNRAIARSLSTAAMRDSLAKEGMTAAPTTAAQFQKYIKSEVVRWRQVIRLMEHQV